MAEIVLCCGKVCSGKSTFARSLEASHGFVAFSSDEWMRHFYAETTDRAIFDANLARCEEMILRVAEKVLARGQDVVLDAGFWKQAERQGLRQRFGRPGQVCTLVHFPIDLATQLRYMEARQNDPALDHYRFDEATVTTLNGFFEEPGPGEPLTSPEAWLAARATR